MPSRTYTRKTDPAGRPADPTVGDPSFTSGIATAIPGRTWTTHADASDVTLNISGGDLTQQEDDDLTAAHTAWVTIDATRYADLYEVETQTGGKTSKREWFETDNGDGTYSNLSRDETWTWLAGKLQTIVAKSYHKDGSVVAGSTVTTNYYTTSDGKKVTKVT